MAKVSVFTATGSGSVSGLAYGENPMFSSGSDLARQRQAVVVGSDNKPYFLTNFYGQGTGDSTDETFVEKRKDGRNFVANQLKTGVQGMLSGELVWRYPLNKIWFPNIFGKAKAVERVGADFAPNVAGTLRRFRYEYPRVGAPTIELWDIFYGTKNNAVKYGRAKTRSFNQDGSRGGDAGDLTGNIEFHANDVQYDTVFPGYVAESARQNVSVSGATGGTFTLTVTNPVTGVTETTAALAHNITAAALQTALEALGNVGSGDLTVTGTAPYQIDGAGAFANKALATIEANASGLTGTGAAVKVTVVRAGSDGLGPIEPLDNPIGIDDKWVYVAKTDAELALIDFTDADDVRKIDTTASSFNASDLWNPHFTENGSRTPSSFVMASQFGASIQLERGTATEKWLRDNTNGCSTEKFWLVFKEQCGQNALVVKMFVQRNAAAEPSNDNDVYQATYALAVCDHPTLSPFQMDVYEPWS